MHERSWQIGFARRSIVPPSGYLRSQWGGQALPATTTLRPLRATAMTIGDGRRLVALVSLDLCLINDDIVARVAAGWTRRHPDLAGHVVLNCSHTHEAPVMGAPGDASYSLGYDAMLVEAILDAIDDARVAARPATLALARQETSGLNRNRRRPDQPIDRTLSALVAAGPDGRPLGVAWHFAAHPLTNMGTAAIWDSDFPGVADAEIEASLPGVSAQFLQGPAGDVFPLDWYFDQESPSLPVSDATARTMGAALAGHVRHLLDAALPLDSATGLAWEETSLELPTRSTTWTAAEADATAEALERRIGTSTYEPWGEDDHVTTIAQRHEDRYAAVCARFCAEMARRAGSTMACRLSAVRLGELALVAVPGELFSALAADIVRGSPHRHTLVLAYSNGSILYIPTRHDLEEVAGWPLAAFLDQKRHRWAYGATATTFIAAGAGEMIVDAAIGLLRRLHVPASGGAAVAS